VLPASDLGDLTELDSPIAPLMQIAELSLDGMAIVPTASKHDNERDIKETRTTVGAGTADSTSEKSRIADIGCRVVVYKLNGTTFDVGSR
jgi:hypothetical protein